MKIQNRQGNNNSTQETSHTRRGSNFTLLGGGNLPEGGCSSVSFSVGCGSNGGCARSAVKAAAVQATLGMGVSHSHECEGLLWWREGLIALYGWLSTVRSVRRMARDGSCDSRKKEHRGLRCERARGGRGGLRYAKREPRGPRGGARRRWRLVL